VGAMTTTPLKIAIFVPAFNVARTLPDLLDRIPVAIRDEVQEIFVIDNNSPDNTYLIAVGYKNLRDGFKLSVFRNKDNYGYGGSQKIAYSYALEQGYDVVVMLHGDAQYGPEHLPSILQPFRERSDVDMVFGSRMSGDPLKGGMPLHKYFGNRTLTWFQNLVLGTKLSEFHSGYRAFNCHSLRRVPFTLCSDNYHFDSEIMIQMVAAGMTIVEMPVPTHYGVVKSGVNIWRYAFDIFRVTGKYYLHKRGLRYDPAFDISQKLVVEDYGSRTVRVR